MAPAAASARHAIRRERLAVAHRRGRFHSLDDRLHRRSAGDLPAGSGHGLPHCGMVCRFDLCPQSQSDLHASHGHDRVALSGALHLGSGLFFRVRATGGCKFAPCPEVAGTLVADDLRLHAGALRWLVPRRMRFCRAGHCLMAFGNSRRADSPGRNPLCAAARVHGLPVARL